MDEDNNNTLGSILGAAGDAAQGYFASQNVPRAVAANPNAGRKMDLSLPLLIGGGVLVLVLVLVFAMGRR